MRTCTFDPEDKCVIKLLYSHIDFNQLSVASVAGNLSFRKFRPLINSCDGNGANALVDPAVAPCRRDVCGANRVDGRRTIHILGRIAPCDYMQIYLLRALHPDRSTSTATGNPSRHLLCDGTYDRLQGDPFIQLFLFQRAMMNGEAVQLAI